jgi:hypothetical protein
MTTKTDQPQELIQPICPNIFFNRPGEPSITRQPNNTIFSYFQNYFQGCNPVNGKCLFGAANYAIIKEGFTPGTPISVYLQGGADLVPNLVLFGPGALLPHQVYDSPSGPIATTNTGCFYMFDVERKKFVDLGSLYQDTHMQGTVLRDPTTGKCQTTAWSYLKKDGSPITLNNVYDVITKVMNCQGRDLSQAALACISCRTSADGAIRRTPSFTLSPLGLMPAKYKDGFGRGGRRRTKTRGNPNNPKRMCKNKRTLRRSRSRNRIRNRNTKKN